ncbi:TPA: hypothetical protein P2L18_002106 [Aeromonas salmonicida]|nr:hypothetical protein [Aeromonas salmonicida]HDN9520056.1 hypothetical protein [Aeromonas salmonicida]
MNSVNQIQIQRFKRLFPELPSELAGVVLLYAAGATQANIVGIFKCLSRKQVADMLHRAKRELDLHSVQAIRVVVHNRLYFAVLERLNF